MAPAARKADMATVNWGELSVWRDNCKWPQLLSGWSCVNPVANARGQDYYTPTSCDLRTCKAQTFNHQMGFQKKKVGRNDHGEAGIVVVGKKHRSRGAGATSEGASSKAFIAGLQRLICGGSGAWHTPSVTWPGSPNPHGPAACGGRNEKTAKQQVLYRSIRIVLPCWRVNFSPRVRDEAGASLPVSTRIWQPMQLPIAPPQKGPGRGARDSPTLSANPLASSASSLRIRWACRWTFRPCDEPDACKTCWKARRPPEGYRDCGGF